MTALPANPVPSQPPSSTARCVATVRAVAAVLWAIGLLAVIHGRLVRVGSDIPLSAGLLLAAYPLIDAVASLFERQEPRARTYAARVIDTVAVAGLLIATLTLHVGVVLVAFGAWACASGLLQLLQAWGAATARRAQLPLIVSGALSTIAGIAFAAMAAQPTAHLANLGGYAVLGAVFFLMWTVLNRKAQALTGPGA